VPVNQVVALIGEAGEQAGAAPAAEAPAAEPLKSSAEMETITSDTQQAKQEEKARGDAGTPPPTVSSPEPQPQAKADATQGTREQSVERDSGETAQAKQSTDAAPATDAEDRLRKFSSPLVRNIASKEGVNLEEVQGTGAQGRVTKDDILSHLDQRKSAPAAPAPQPAAAAPAAPAPAPAAAAPAQRPAGSFQVAAYTAADDVEIEPMSKIRQITMAHMVYSKATSAHVTTVFEMDLSRVARARARAKDGFLKKEGTKLSYMPFIFRAVTNGLKAHKKLNCSIEGTSIIYKKNINLGMAVDLGHGLIVPVIKNADQLSLVGLAKTANDLADRARSKKLKPDEAQGGTFTITNPGVFGSLFGTPIINQPQVAILGIGVVEKRPVVVEDADGNDTIAIKTMAYFGISYDHRIVDGADADRFMIDVKKTLETDSWTELEAYY
jgi:2-oxoglutarate dehydrogenase E2 component (dihydrolipoamide succinyltransferase)